MVVNSSRHYAEQFARRAAASGTDETFRVLDAGAGSAPYRPHFAHLSYETADVAATEGKDYGHLDHVCDIVDLPMEDGTYDLVWCSQTLEHVTEPIAALREFHRVLVPGGHAWLTAPFSYVEHEQPYDFYRFTRFAWQYFAEQVGFEVVEIEPLEGYYGTLAHQLQVAARSLPKPMRRRRRFFRETAEALAALDLTDKRTDIGSCKNY